MAPAERVAFSAKFADVPPSAELHITVAGHELTITSPDKVYFPDRQTTKRQLIEFYLAIGEPLMRAMRNRPVLLQRFPNGSPGSSFFQKRIPDSAPEWLSTVEVSTPNGTVSRALVIADLAHFVWAVNLGCLGFHSWPVRADDIERVDELRIDLDPQPGTSFVMAQETAAEVARLFAELGVRGFIKTTGNRGLHVYVRLGPSWDAYAVRSAAVAVARELERRRPDLITAAWWKEQRGERIFIDYNQNAPHKTVFAPWSVRARDHAPVSCPFEWSELERIDPNALTTATVPERLQHDGDPWASMDDVAQSLEPFLELVRRDQAAGLDDAPWPPVYPKMANEPARVAPSRAKKRAT